MKKILLSLFAVMFAICANAQYNLTWTEPSDWTGVADKASVISITKDGYTVTIDKTEKGATVPTVNATAKDARCYAKAAITISCENEMKTITFNISDQGLKRLTDITANSGEVTYGDKTVTWAGSAKEVVFVVGDQATRGTDGAAKAGQLCFNSITFNGDVPEEVEPETPVDISNTPETAYTVTKALELIEAGKGLGTKVYVKGTITKVDEISTSYGNATYYISDGSKELMVYRGYGLGGDKFTTEDDIQDGDEVIVYGNLVNFHDTPEFTTGSIIYSLNGKTKEDVGGGNEQEPEETYTCVGAGTLSSPYTTEDIIKGVYKDGEQVEGVWIKGTILGCFGSANEPISAKDAVATNIALGNADSTCIIPVQLVYVKDGDNTVRETLNVMDNPDNIGKEVYVFGTVETYFKVAGVKSTSDFSWDGITTSIKGVSTAAKTVIYNMAGQRINTLQKGVNIVNGAKVLVK